MLLLSIAAAVGAVPWLGATASAAVAATAVPPAATAAGTWVWPVDGPRAVVRPFDPPATRYGAGHRGADVAAPVGGVIRAAGAGRISYAGLLAGRGVVVVVHGELRTTYEPVSAGVRVGQQVSAGAVIGRLALGGHCAAGCLHWGLLRGDVYLDPVRLVGRGPSRLLPVPDAGAAARTVPLARSGRPAAPESSTPRVEPAGEPGFALRAAQVPWAAGAVLALLLGLALLRRSPPHPQPPQPAAPLSRALPRPPTAAPLTTVTEHPVVDLAVERSRRRTA